MPTCAHCSLEKPPRAFPPRAGGARPDCCRGCAGARHLAGTLAAAGIAPGEGLTLAEAAIAAGKPAGTLAHAATRGRLRTVRAGNRRYTTARWVAMWHAAWVEDGAG